MASSAIVVFRELIVNLGAEKHLGLDHADMAHRIDSKHRQRSATPPFTIMWGNGGDTVGQMKIRRKGNTLRVFVEAV